MIDDKRGDKKKEFCEAFRAIIQCDYWIGCEETCPLRCWLFCAEQGGDVRRSVETWISRSLNENMTHRILTDALGEDINNVRKRVKGDK